MSERAEMRIPALTLAAALLMPACAYAAPHHPITDAEHYHCLTMDNDDDGTEYCVKSGKGMTQKQIDAWYEKEAARALALSKARDKKRTEPGYENCLREANAANGPNGWNNGGGMPSKDDCRDWVHAVEQKHTDIIDEAFKEMMK
jgi:hypothetical protein